MGPVSLGTQATTVFILKLSFLIPLMIPLIFLLILLYNIDILDFNIWGLYTKGVWGFIIIIFPYKKASTEICVLNAHGEH